MKPHEANQAFWNASTDWWKEKEDQRGRWLKAHEDPTLVLSPAEMPFLKDIDGKDVCVLGSGDNEVGGFALDLIFAHCKNRTQFARFICRNHTGDKHQQ